MTDRGTYIKMSDSLPEHRKIVAAGGDAAWLHVCALAYASRNRTDGQIPEGMVPRLSDRKQPAKLAARLCDVDLWHTAGHHCKRCPQPAAGHYIVHDYLEHQRSAARIAEVSEQRSRAGRAGGSKPKAKAKQVASGLPASGFAGAEANGQRSFAEGSLREPQADAQSQQPPVAAGDSAPTLTVNQRAKRLTDAYAEAEPMCKWPAVNGVVIRAIESKRFGDDAIRAALLRLAAENRSVTIDSLRTELGGLPPSRGKTGGGTRQPYANPEDDAVYDRKY